MIKWIKCFFNKHNYHIHYNTRCNNYRWYDYRYMDFENITKVQCKNCNFINNDYKIELNYNIKQLQRELIKKVNIYEKLFNIK